MGLTHDMLAFVQVMLTIAYRRKDDGVIRRLERIEDYLLRRYTR